MKKRVKLLTTIASLCLAVALMAFGVYAATAAGNFKTSSTIQFQVSEYVYGNFTAALTGKATDTVTASRAQGVEDWTVSAGDDAVLADGVVLGTANMPLTTVNDKYTFTFTFENTSAYDVTATATITGISDSVPQVKDTSKDAITVDVSGCDTTAQTIKPGESFDWVITVELKSLDIGATATITIPFSLAVTK